MCNVGIKIMLILKKSRTWSQVRDTWDVHVAWGRVRSCASSRLRFPSGVRATSITASPAEAQAAASCEASDEWKQAEARTRRPPGCALCLCLTSHM